MNNFKKRLLSSVLAFAMVLTSGSFTVFAEAEIAENGIYADSYGIEVAFTTTPAASDYATLEVTEMDGTAVEFATPTVDENNVLCIHFNEPITVGEDYILNVNGVKNKITVVQEFFEDFNSLDFTTKTGEDYQTMTAHNGSTDGLAWTVVNASGSGTPRGGFITSDKLGATAADKKLVLFGANARFNTTAKPTWQDKSVTFSADTAVYRTAEGTTSTTVYLGGKYESQGNTFLMSNNTSYLSYNSRNDGISVTHTDAFGTIADFNATTASFTDTDENVTDAKTITHVIRQKAQTYYSGYAGEAGALTFTGVQTANYLKNATTGFGVKNNKDNTLTVVDNLLVTSCVVEEYVEAELVEDGIYADKYGIEIEYTAIPHASDYATLEVVDSKGEDVAFTPQVIDNFLYVHFNSPITVGEQYILTINDVQKTVKVVQEYKEDFESADLTGATTAKEGDFSTANTNYTRHTNEDGVEWWLVDSGAGGMYITQDTNLGASANDQKLVLFGAGARMNSYSALTWRGTDVTFSAETELYYIDTASATAPNGFVSTGDRYEGVANGAKIYSIYDQKADLSNNATMALGTSVAGTIAGFTATDGKFTSVTKEPTLATYAIRTRATGDYVGYADLGTSVKFGGTRNNRPDHSSYGGFAVSSRNENTFMVVDNLVVTSCEIEDYIDAELIEDGIYADKYGIEIPFTATPSEVDYATLEVTDLRGSDVAFTTQVVDNFLYVHFNSPITVGEYYNLNVNGTRKLVKVVQEYKEDFESADLTGATTAIEGDFSTANSNYTRHTNNGVEWWLVDSGAGGMFITQDTNLGASANDQKLVLFGAGARMNSYSALSWRGTDVTFSAETELYYIDETATAPNGFVSTGDRYEGVANGAKIYSISDGSALLSYNDATTFGATTAGTIAGFTATDGKFTSVTKEPTLATYAIRTRANGDYVGYSDIGTSVKFSGKRNNNPDGASYGGFAVSSRNANTFMVVDNLVVTSCEITDTVADAEIAEVYADRYGAEITFKSTPSFAQQSFVSIKDTAGKEVLFEKEIDTTNSVIKLHFDEPIKLDTYYTIDVNGTLKNIKVVKEFLEDFNSSDLTGATTATVTDGVADYSKWTNISHTVDGVTWNVVDDGTGNGAFITADTELGAEEGNQKLALFGSGARLNTTTKPSWQDKDVTFSAETELYEIATPPTNSYASGMVYAGNKYQGSPARTFLIKEKSSQLSIGGTNAATYPTVTTSDVATKGTVAGFNTATGVYTGAEKATTMIHAIRQIGDTSFSGYAGLSTNLQFVKTQIDVAKATTTGFGARSQNAYTMLVIDNLLVTSCVVEEYVEADIVEDGIYADKYGIEIPFTATPSAIDYATLEVTDLRGSDVAFTTQVVDNFLYVHFNSPITVGEYYNLNVNGTRKLVKVVQEYVENFNSADIAAYTTAIDGDFSTANSNYTRHTNNGVEWWLVDSGAGGMFITQDTNLGASANDQKLVLFGAGARMNSYSALTWRGTDVTFSAETELYYIDANGTAPNGFVTVGDRYERPANGAKIYSISDGSALLSYNDATTFGATTAGTIAGFTATDGKFTSVTKEPTLATYAIRTRANGDYVGYSDIGTSVKFSGKRNNNPDEATYGGFTVSSRNENTFMVVDNLLVTSCVVEEYVDAELIADGIYADKYGIEIPFTATPSAVNYATLEVTDLSGNKVAFTTQVIDKFLYVHFNNPITVGKYYILNVNGVKKIVRVVQEYTENFNSANLTGTTTAIEGDFSTANSNYTRHTNKGVEWWLVDSGAGGMFITQDTKLGASADDQKLVLFGAGARMNSYSALTWRGTDVTFSAETELYYIDETATAPNGFVSVGDRYERPANGAKIYSISDGSALLSYNDATTFGATTAGTIAGFTATDGKFTSVTKAPTLATYAIRTRANGDYVGYSDIGTSVKFSGKRNNNPDEASYGGFTVSSRNANTFMVVDNLLVTSCEITDIDAMGEDAEIKKVYADIYGIDVVFADTPSVVQKGEVTVQTARLKDVALNTPEYDDEAKTLRITFAQPIKTDVTYILAVGGTKKTFKVKTIVNEDFENFADRKTDPSSWPTEGGEILDGKMYLDARAVVTTDSRFGASTKDKKLLMQGAGIYTTAKAGIGLDSTITAKVDTYINGGRYWEEPQLYKRNVNKVNEKDYADWNGNRLLMWPSAARVENRKTASEYNAPSINNVTYCGIAWIHGILGERQMSDANGTLDNATVYEYPYSGQKTTKEPIYNIHAALRSYSTNNTASNVLQGLISNGDETPEYFGSTVDANNTVTDGSKVGFEQPSTAAISVIDDLLITTCEVGNYTGSVADTITVQDIWADTKGIYVQFDTANFEADDNFSGISVLKDGEPVKFEASVSGNIVTINPEGGVESENNEIFTVTVPQGFAPSAVAVTDKEYSKNFRLTVYAKQNFDSFDVDATDGDIITTKGTTAPLTLVQDGALVLRDATLAIPAVKDATDYKVEFNAKVYTSVIDKDYNGDIEEDLYNNPVPNLKMWYNSDAQTGANRAFWWNIQNDTVQRMFTSEHGVPTPVDTEAQATSAIVFGDAVYDAVNEEEFIALNKGDDLSDYIISIEEDESLREAQEYAVKVEKFGKAGNYYVDGELVSAFAGSEEDGAAGDTGYFGLNVSDWEFVVIDDIVVYNYEEFDDLIVELTDTTISVENITTTSKPVVVVVAAYNESGAMIDAWVSLNTTVPANKDISDEYDLNTTGATKIKAFVWNNMTDLVPYSSAPKYVDISQS